MSLEFTLLPNVQTWYEDVSCYEVRDQNTQDVLGHFYLDLLPRENKYTHAAAFPLIKRAKVGGKVVAPAVAMVTNFEPSAEDEPVLLQHH